MRPTTKPRMKASERKAMEVKLRCWDNPLSFSQAERIYLLKAVKFVYERRSRYSTIAPRSE